MYGLFICVGSFGSVRSTTLCLRFCRKQQKLNLICGRGPHVLLEMQISMFFSMSFFRPNTTLNLRPRHRCPSPLSMRPQRQVCGTSQRPYEPKCGMKSAMAVPFWRLRNWSNFQELHGYIYIYIYRYCYDLLWYDMPKTLHERPMYYPQLTVVWQNSPLGSPFDGLD